MAKRYDILCLPPQDKPVYFVVEAFAPDDREISQYHYEEGSCPHDFFGRGCVSIIVDGDTDPHGLFDFVRSTEPLEFLERAHTSDAWVEVIPEAFPKTGS